MDGPGRIAAAGPFADREVLDQLGRKAECFIME
jgi:hypothetical protein